MLVLTCFLSRCKAYGTRDGWTYGRLLQSCVLVSQRVIHTAASKACVHSCVFIVRYRWDSYWPVVRTSFAWIGNANVQGWVCLPHTELLPGAKRLSVQKVHPRQPTMVTHPPGGRAPSTASRLHAFPKSSNLQVQVAMSPRSALLCPGDMPVTSALLRPGSAGAMPLACWHGCWCWCGTWWWWWWRWVGWSRDKQKLPGFMSQCASRADLHVPMHGGSQHNLMSLHRSMPTSPVRVTSVVARSGRRPGARCMWHDASTLLLAVCSTHCSRCPGETPPDASANVQS